MQETTVSFLQTAFQTTRGARTANSNGRISMVRGLLASWRVGRDSVKWTHRTVAARQRESAFFPRYPDTLARCYARRYNARPAAAASLHGAIRSGVLKRSEIS